MKRIFSIILSAIMLCCLSASAQNTVRWKVAYQNEPNGEAIVTIAADIANGWHIYGTEPTDIGPVPTTIKLEGNGFKLIGEPKADPKPSKVYDEMFGGEVTYWEGKVSFAQKIKRTSKGTVNIKVTVTFMCCDDTNCQPPRTETYTLSIK